jgi:hypothetical protein
VRYFDETLEGRVVVSHNVVDEVPEAWAPLTVTGDNGPAPPLELRLVAGPPAKLRLRSASVLPAVSVHGLAFDFFNLAGYSRESRLSFVFAGGTGYPELDGRFVNVHEQAECQESEDEPLRQASSYLDSPAVHLRRFHECWMDMFLGTIKYFSAPDLKFWRYEPNPGYPALRQIFEEARFSLAAPAGPGFATRYRSSSQLLRPRAFDVLVQRFADEVAGRAIDLAPQAFWVSLLGRSRRGRSPTSGPAWPA